MTSLPSTRRWARVFPVALLAATVLTTVATPAEARAFRSSPAETSPTPLGDASEAWSGIRTTGEDGRTAAPRTRLTFTVDDCEGCRIQLTSALGTYADADAGTLKIWNSATRVVREGSVTFRVATSLTRGMSASVRAPWEGFTGYRTTVAWRYNGEQVGDDVTLEEAVTKTRASACWEGVRRRRVTVPLVVKEVEVGGVRKRVPGSIAFVPTTQSWLMPMREVWDGVLGSQDVNICH